ncbi:MAG: ABC transporter permease [Lachnospiraceae bacterium]
MLQYLAKRIGRSMISLFIIISVVFILLRQMPIEGYFSNFDKLSDLQIQNGLEQLGLLDPMPVQLFNFWKELLLEGSLGNSITYREDVPVIDIVVEKLPYSIKLGSMAILLSLFIGIPMGTLMARYKGKFFDKFGTMFIVFIQAVPAAVYFLFVQLYGTLALDISLLFNEANPKSWILPVISLALGNIAYYAMWLRRYMVDELNKDYVKLATAKGLSGNKVMFTHVFRNAFVPLVQYLPSSFLNTIIGSIYIESLYSVPGMGGLLVQVIKASDNNMVQGIVLMFATVGVLGLLLGDLMMTVLDPRIKLNKQGEGR